MQECFSFNIRMLVCWFPHRLWNRLHTSARLGPTSSKQPEPLEIAGVLSRMFCITAFSVDRVVELWGTLRELPNMLFVVQFMLHRGVVLCGLKLSKDNLGMKTRSNAQRTFASWVWLTDWCRSTMRLSRYFGTAFSTIIVCKTMSLNSLNWSNNSCC